MMGARWSWLYLLSVFMPGIVSAGYGLSTTSAAASDPCTAAQNYVKNTLINNPTNAATLVNSSSLKNISESCFRTFPTQLKPNTSKTLVTKLSKVYSSLSNNTRTAVYEWIKNVSTPKITASTGQTVSWITVDSLQLLSIFLLQMPISELKGIVINSNSPNCKFFTTSTTVWSQMLEVTKEQAKILINATITCKFKLNNANLLPGLGQLLCYFTDFVDHLNSVGKKTLLNLLSMCSNNVAELTQKLKAPANVTIKNLTSDALKNLGEAAVDLSLQQIVNLSTAAVEGSLQSLGSVSGWTKSQMQVIVKKVNVTDQKLQQMGSLMAGIPTGQLQTLSGSALLQAVSNQSMADVVDSMTSAQSKAIVSQALKDGNASSVLRQLPDSLLQYVPAAAFKDVNDSSAAELLSRSQALRKSQVLTLVKKIPLNTLNSSQSISDMKSSIQGLSCEDLKQLNTDALVAVGRSPFASRYLIQCAAKQYFKLMMVTNSSYFSSLTKDDLSSIPEGFLLYEPPLAVLKQIPVSICPNILQLLGAADITFLARKASRRVDLLSYIKICLNMTQMQSLTVDQAQSLGNMVCVFGAPEVSSLPSALFKGIMQQLMACGKFEGPLKDAVRQQILQVFKDTATWTDVTLSALGVLAATLSAQDMAKIPNTENVKVALISIISSATSFSTSSSIPAFNNMPNMTILAGKISDIYNGSPSARRRRAADCTNVVTPTLDIIQQLGDSNSMWSPTQLSCLPNQTFLDGLPTLGAVTSFSWDQQSALKGKALQVFSGSITNAQIVSLMRINLGFTGSEVTSFFSQVDTDTMAEISGYSEWASTSYTTQATNILKIYLGSRSPSTLLDTELVSLGYFLCVMPLDQIALIDSNAYSTAASSLGQVLCPDPAVLSALKMKAVESFGSPSSWSADICQEVGSVLAGLSNTELSQLSVSVMAFLDPNCISLIPSNVLVSLSADQLLNLGPENSWAVSEDQRSSLSSWQIAAMAGNDEYSNAAGSVQISLICIISAALIIIIM
ncbi:otoancorin-like isoform X2 [Mixophyes fleayi]|uniref:otoancorin-like isoform X2 n=1 Tax=Mixophyes fleayi TaxID=3061075 RepID=UPI003F4E061E